MIEEGKKSKAKYWGNYEVKKIIKLSKPVICQSEEVGKVEFMPTIIKLEWENTPSEDKHDLWFPYWITIHGKERYGQFAPMIGQKAFLELLQGAIKNGLFENDFLEALKISINNKLSQNFPPPESTA